MSRQMSGVNLPSFHLQANRNKKFALDCYSNVPAICYETNSSTIKSNCSNNQIEF